MYCLFAFVTLYGDCVYMIEDITFIGLGIGLLLMIVPFFFLSKYRTGLLRPAMGGTIRMIVQLYLIGLYLQYLFEYNLWYVNLAWGLMMVLVATGTALQRTKLKPTVLAVPMFVGFLSTAIIISVYFLGLVLGLYSTDGTGLTLTTLFTAQYFIPIFGLLLGNMLGVNVVALNTYYEGVKREQQTYYYMLGNGATRWEATAPFLRTAIIKAFNPCIANMAVMGLVAMPGTMIGQILGGSNPALAIKYQMMIVVITFVASMMSLMITVGLATRKSFDRMGRLKDVFEN